MDGRVTPAIVWTGRAARVGDVVLDYEQGVGRRFGLIKLVMIKTEND